MSIASEGVRRLAVKGVQGVPGSVPAFARSSAQGGEQVREFLSKFTFGFLMAQLVPGAVALLFITLAVGASTHRSLPRTVSSVLENAVEPWFDVDCCVTDGAPQSQLPISLGPGTPRPTPATTVKAVVFFLLALAIGMLIHGTNWMVLAWLENHEGRPGCNGWPEPTPVRFSFWHRWRVVLQLPVAPVKMLIELAWVLTAPGIVALAMDENAPRISKEQTDMFTFVQDFYLHFSQFYAHSAYAMLLGVPCLILYHRSAGHYFLQALPGVAGVYLLTSVFFIIGRVQYTSMCRAENKFLGNMPEPELAVPRDGASDPERSVWQRVRQWLFEGW